MRKSGTCVGFGQSRIGEIGLYRVSQRGIVTRIDNRPGLARDDHFLVSAGITGDNGRLGGHGFERCQAETFIAGWGDIERQPPVPGLDVVNFALKYDAVGKAGCGDIGLERITEGLVFRRDAAGHYSCPLRMVGQKFDHGAHE